MRASRNGHREKVVVAKAELKDAKKKNKALSNLLSAEKTKSVEINHRAWLDKKENLTLLTEATKSHQAELKEQQDKSQETLRNERRRFKEEMSVQERKLSAETLLCTYLQQKYDKKTKKEN